MNEELAKRFDHVEALIDALASTTASNFSGVNERIDGVVERLDAFEKRTELRFDGIDGKIDGLQRAVDAGFERHSALEARVSKIETQLHI